MSFLSKNPKITVACDPQLWELLNTRLPRNYKVSIGVRWFLRALVMDAKELTAYCWENEAEAREVGPVMQECLSKMFESQKISEQKKATKREVKAR